MCLPALTTQPIIKRQQRQISQWGNWHQINFLICRAYSVILTLLIHSFKLAVRQQQIKHAKTMYIVTRRVSHTCTHKKGCLKKLSVQVFFFCHSELKWRTRNTLFEIISELGNTFYLVNSLTCVFFSHFQ